MKENWLKKWNYYKREKLIKKRAQNLKKKKRRKIIKKATNFEKKIKEEENWLFKKK